MQQSKLIQLYTCFDSQELEALHKWVNSPLHNKDPKVQQLVLHLSSRRQLTPTNLDKKRLFKAIYPHQAYEDQQWRRLVSKTVQCLEKFVQFWMSKQDTVYQQQQLLLFLQQHQRPKLAQQQAKKVAQLLEQAPTQTSSYYYQSYQLKKAVFEADAQQNRMTATNLQSLIHDFSISFMIESLHLACTAHSHQNLYKSAYEMPFLEQVLKQIEEPIYQESIALQLYAKAYRSLVAYQDDSHFETFKAYLLTHAAILSPAEQKNLYTLAINYCVRHINHNESQHYMQQVFELYQQGIANEVLLSNGQLSRFAYKNIAAVGLRLGEYDWVATFIKEYLPYLEEGYRANYYHYNLCKWHFAKGDYDQALELLGQVEYDDLFLNLDAKTTLMKIYYETQNFLPLEAFFHSFAIYLQRKDIMGYHRKNYQHILKLTKKLVALPPYDTAAKVALKESILSTHPLTERPWLLQQLTQL